jgi:murein DD-endopeptidase MepM/ murein hydrolase activator NlpD
VNKGLRRHITLLILQDEATEAFTLRIPAYLFHFLVLLLVCVLIGAGLATVWLGEITVKLQAMDVVDQENKRLRTQLSKANQLQEELLVLEERERRILNLAQAFLDDTTSRAASTEARPGGEIFDDGKRDKVVTAILGHERDLVLNRFRETKSSLPPGLFALRPTLGWKSLEVPSTLETQFQGAAAKPLIVPPGDPVLAPLSGIVTEAGFDPVLGLTVTIHDEGAYAVSIGHLGELDVRKGDFLRNGTPIGRAMTGSGETGAYILLRLQRLDLAIQPEGVLIE